MVPELIKIKVNTKIDLKQVLGQDEMDIFVPKGSTLGEVIVLMVDTWGERLASRLLAPGSDALRPGVCIQVNDRDTGLLSGLGTVLVDGDRVSVLPHGKGNA
jgi:molybdopterin converting factor small subunit